MPTPQELSMSVTTPIATRFDAQAATGQVTAVKPATVETNSIEEGAGCNGRLGAGLTERNLTSRWVGPAHAEPVVQGTAGCHAGGNLPAEITSFVAPRTRRCEARLVQVQAGHFDRCWWRRQDTRCRAGGKGPQARLSARRLAGNLCLATHLRET